MRLPRPRSLMGWAGALVGAALLGGTLFVLIAPYNISARIPHLPGVGWVLNTYMTRAVKTWSTGVAPPRWLDLGDPALVRLGAAHYEAGCAPCHGTPGRSPNPLTKGMQPAPPSMREALPKYDAAEFWWLVHNGLKYTAMPAWSGAGRADEPWALAAFLMRYGALEPPDYLALAYGEARPAGLPADGDAVRFGSTTGRLDAVAEDCARCHGKDGLGRDGTAPKLAGQSEEYLGQSLDAYAKNRRQSGIMEPIAAGLSDQERARLAADYAARPAFDADPVPADPALLAEGAELARRGTDLIPSCVACHGAGTQAPEKAIYPRISGQSRRWLVTWLHLWREDDIGGTRHSHLMHAAARDLTDGQIEALAAFFAGGATGANDRDEASRAVQDGAAEERDTVPPR